MKKPAKSKTREFSPQAVIKITSLGKIIARRKLTVRGILDRKVIVAIGTPRPFEDFPGYYCPFQITGAGHEQIRYAAGKDDVEALAAVMPMIAIEIAVLHRDFGVELRWEGDSSDPYCGFPSPI